LFHKYCIIKYIDKKMTSAIKIRNKDCHSITNGISVEINTINIKVLINYSIF